MVESKNNDFNHTFNANSKHNTLLNLRDREDKNQCSFVQIGNEISID
jgi:hypothetical protein